jgi:hypothetical protein
VANALIKRRLKQAQSARGRQGCPHDSRRAKTKSGGLMVWQGFPVKSEEIAGENSSFSGVVPSWTFEIDDHSVTWWCLSVSRQE